MLFESNLQLGQTKWSVWIGGMELGALRTERMMTDGEGITEDDEGWNLSNFLDEEMEKNPRWKYQPQISSAQGFFFLLLI